MELNSDDVLVLQRQHAEPVLNIAKAFKEKGGKLVFELDDYFHDLPPNNPARKSYPPGGKELKNMEKFMQLSDLMTVSTPQLKNKYSKFANNIHVCYNSIDLEDLNHITETNPREDNSIRLGWAGSATHLDDLKIIIKPISEIMYEYPNTKFVFVGMDYRNLFPLELRHRMVNAGHTFPIHNGKALFYSHDSVNPVIQYYSLLRNAHIDIAIAPLLPVTFNSTKSFIKLIEYGIANIPFVASDYGPYSQYVRQTKDQVGYLATTNSEWKKYIKKYIENPELKKQITQNNYQNVINNHTINKNINQWVTALASINVHPKGEGNYKEQIIKMN